MQVRTDLTFQDVSLVERTGELVQVRAKVSRAKSKLVDGRDTSTDQLASDLVLKVVPRTTERPDGLEVIEWRLKVLTGDATGAPTSEGDVHAQ